MLSETEVYLALKNFLQEKEWNILGGQPPGGTNVIPLIELKDTSNTNKGSKGSKKIDLIAYRNGYFLLLELKPSLASEDIKKLEAIASNVVWRGALIKALKEKRALPEDLPEETYIDSDRFLIKALGFNSGEGVGPVDFLTFLVSTDGVDTHFGEELSPSIKNLF